MRHNLILTLAFLSIFRGSVARAGDFRFVLLVGSGSASLTDSTLAIERTESPFSMNAGFDYLMDSRRLIGIEMLRAVALSPFSTRVSFIGVQFKQYFLAPVPTRQGESGVIRQSVVIRSVFSPFVAACTGIAQASFDRRDVRDTGIAATGLYLGGKVGADFPLSGDLGLEAYGGYNTSFGTPIRMMSFGAGIYLYL